MPLNIDSIVLNGQTGDLPGAVTGEVYFDDKHKMLKVRYGTGSKEVVTGVDNLTVHITGPTGARVAAVKPGGVPASYVSVATGDFGGVLAGTTGDVQSTFQKLSTLRHQDVVDMPDVTGGVTDHDVRLVAKVTGSAPTLPAPFKGMMWLDVGAPTPIMTIAIHSISSGPYTVLISDECLIVTSGTFQINLPAATGSGRLLFIKSLSLGTITVEGDGADTIDGQPNQLLLQYDCLEIADYAVGAWVIL